MRVTHIITRLVVGGAQENTVSSVLGLMSRHGVACDLVAGPALGPEGSLEHRVSQQPGLLTIVPELVRNVHPWKDWIALLKLTRLLRRFQPDIVHTHSSKAGILGRLAARRAGVRRIVHHIHGPAFGPFQGPLANAIFTAAERHAAKVTDHFLCSSQAMARIYLAAGIGRPENYTRLFSGFDVAPFLAATNDPARRIALGFSPADFIIGQVSRFVPAKGQGPLLDAFKLVLPQVPRARLLFVGDGPDKARIEERVRQEGLGDKVVFTGLVAPEEVPHHVGLMDCLAHLSTFPEGLPRVLPQALAAAKPIVSYDFDGADEVCLDGETGFLVPRGQVALAAERLVQLAASSELRTRLAHRGRELVRDEFTVDAMVDRQYRLYRELLSRPVASAR